MRTRILAVVDVEDVEYIDSTVTKGTFDTRGHYVRQAIKFFREAKDGLK
jgi:Arc/MetJ-type ribon-helix-helix transcriptional regulator